MTPFLMGTVNNLRVYLWRILVDIWQNQYNIVKLKKKKSTCHIKSIIAVSSGRLKTQLRKEGMVKSVWTFLVINLPPSSSVSD